MDTSLSLKRDMAPW